MDFERAFIVAVKSLVITFILYLAGAPILVPLILSGTLIGAIGAVVISFFIGLFALFVMVYFILAEAEKMSIETFRRDSTRYDNLIDNLKRMINEISQASPEEMQAKIEALKSRCPECGKQVPKCFRLCPHCGLDWR